MKPKTALSLAAAGGLLLIDSGYAVYFIQSDILRLATWLELLVFGAQFVKTAFALGVRRVRDGSAALLVDVYGAELLAIPAFLAAILVVGVEPVGALLNQLIRGWMVGVACAGLPYAAFRLGRSMLRSAPLTSVLPSSVAAAEFGVLFVNAASSAAKSHTGLAGVADFALLGRESIASASLPIFAALTDVYAALLLYAVLGMSTNFSLNRGRGLAVSAVATGVTLACTVAFLPWSGSMLMLVPPSVAVAGVSWWVTRGH